MSFGVRSKMVGLNEALKTSEIIAKMGAMKAMGRARDSMLTELQEQTIAALGARTARSWKGKVYPASGNSLEPAALVYSKAPKIIDGFARGATIVAKAGRKLLAIPTDEVPRKRNGQALTPLEVEGRYGKRLRFIPKGTAQGSLIRGGAVGYLVVDGVTSRKSGGPKRNASERELRGGPRSKVKAVEFAIMFVLVSSVKLPKKLDLQAVLDRAAASLPELLQEEWSR